MVRKRLWPFPAFPTDQPGDDEDHCHLSQDKRKPNAVGAHKAHQQEAETKHEHDTAARADDIRDKQVSCALEEVHKGHIDDHERHADRKQLECRNAGFHCFRFVNAEHSRKPAGENIQGYGGG